MHVEVTGTVQKREGISKKTNKPWSMREQEGYLHTTTEKYPRKIKFAVPDEVADGYAIGKYEVDWDKTATVGDFDSLAVGRTLHLAKKVA